MKITQNHTYKKRRNLIIAGSFLAVVLIGLGAYQYLKSRESPPLPGQTANTSSGYDKTENNTSSGSMTTTKDNQSTEATAPDASITPTTPNGTFVSNHHPNLSGQPAPNQESSTCTTTPGANCTIQFTNGDIIKTLPVKATDADGNIDWVWTLQDIGLTTGIWNITAIATNGNETSSAADAMQLVVKP